MVSVSGNARLHGENRRRFSDSERRTLAWLRRNGRGRVRKTDRSRERAAKLVLEKVLEEMGLKKEESSGSTPP